MAPSESTATTRPTRSRTTSQALSKTEISINVYDLLPPSRLSTVLWTLGTSLLHSGLVIGSTHEYAYGGHNIRNKTGVYHTLPRFEPPGATHRTTILVGFSYLSQTEIQDIVHQVSQEYIGTNYNLLTNNCNHFTSTLCQRLTGKAAPAWLNRAAGIGLSLPCIVPREWIDPPDHETANGDLIDEEEDEAETSAMLGESSRREREGTPPARVVKVEGKDSSGREIPVAERAPVPGRK